MQYSISNLNAFFILISIGFTLYYYVNENEEYKELADKNNSPAKRFRKPLLWVLWPNSGKPLKLKVPSCSWKNIRGWTNYSGKVISLKIRENVMGYRGSKSITLMTPIKHIINYNSLPYIITTVRFKSYDSLVRSRLDPWFVTGFTDGEGSFMISFLKNPKVRSDWQIQSIFQIAIHEKDIELLKLIQAYFGGIGK
jgi:LAGLIDADG endonuclease